MAAYKPISGDLIQRFASNVAASGYYLKGYEAGTTTALAMGIDSTPTSTLAKCQINSQGYAVNGSDAPFIPHYNVDYKLVLYSNSTDADADTFGNAVYTIDNISLSNSATDFDYDQGGTGSVARTVTNRLQDFVSLLDFGIDNTGATNATAAIQTVIDNYDSVYAPPGTYKIDSTLYIYKTGMQFIGAGAEATIFSVDAGVEGIVIGNDATSQYTNHYISVRDFKITGGTYCMTVGGNGTGPKAFVGTVNNVLCTAGTVAALRLVSPQGANFSNCGFNDSAIGVIADNTQAVTASCFYRCRFYQNTTDGLKIQQAEHLSFVACNFESNGGWGVNLNRVSAIAGMNFSNCWFESNTSGGLISDSNAIADVNLNFNYFNSQGGAPYHVDFTGSNIRSIGNRFLVSNAADTITAATQANPVVVTTGAAHEYTTGDRVAISGVVGMTEINGRTFTITKSDATNFSLDDEDGTGHTAYTSAGTATTQTVGIIRTAGATYTLNDTGIWNKATATGVNGFDCDQDGLLAAGSLSANPGVGANALAITTGNATISDGSLDVVQSTTATDGATVSSFDINIGGTGVDVARINCGADADRVALKFTIAGVISSYLWVDDTGQPRFKTSLPANDTDGTAM